MTQTESLELLRSQSMTGLVHRELLSRIATGDFQPGMKLNEADIAQRMGVSRGPVREAFRALEESGLVRVEKNRGVYVRSVSLEEAIDIYELRAAIDTAIGRKLAQSRAASTLDSLKDMLGRMRLAADSHDVAGYLSLNLALHDQLALATGNEKLVEVYRRLVMELSLFRREALASSEAALHDSLHEHEDILAAIESGDVELSGQLMRQHVEKGRDRLLRGRDAMASRKGGA